MAKPQGMFVAAGESTIRVSSPDGRAWSEPVVSTKAAKNQNKSWDTGGAFWGLAVGGGRAVAVGPYGSGGTVRSTTTDGVNWSEVEVLEGDKNGRLLDVAYGKGRFVAVGGEVPNYIHGYSTWSDDGVKWSPMLHMHRKEAKYKDGGGLIRVAFGNDRFVAIGRAGKIAVSDNGEDWEFIAKRKTDPLTDTFIELTYGAGVFVGVGLHGLRKTSKDGVEWTNMQTAAEGEHINDIVWTGDRFVGVAPGATFFSPDGIKWTRQPNTNAPVALAYGAGVFVGARYRGVMLRSEDAVTWEQTGKYEEDIRAVDYLPA